VDVRFDLHFDNGDGDPKWLPAVLALIVVLGLVALALGEAILGQP
jgi:hypothetical protein